MEVSVEHFCKVKCIKNRKPLYKKHLSFTEVSNSSCNSCYVKKSRQNVETFERRNNAEHVQIFFIGFVFLIAAISKKEKNTGIYVISGTVNRDPLVKNGIALFLIQSPSKNVASCSKTKLLLHHHIVNLC